MAFPSFEASRVYLFQLRLDAADRPSFGLFRHHPLGMRHSIGHDAAQVRLHSQQKQHAACRRAPLHLGQLELPRYSFACEGNCGHGLEDWHLTAGLHRPHRASTALTVCWAVHKQASPVIPKHWNQKHARLPGDFGKGSHTKEQHLPVTVHVRKKRSWWHWKGSSASTERGTDWLGELSGDLASSDPQLGSFDTKATSEVAADLCHRHGCTCRCKGVLVQGRPFSERRSCLFRA